MEVATVELAAEVGEEEMANAAVSGGGGGDGDVEAKYEIRGKGKDCLVISYQVGFKRDENTLTIDRRTKIYGFYNDRAVFCRNRRRRVSKKNDFLSFQRNERFIVLANKISI